MFYIVFLYLIEAILDHKGYPSPSDNKSPRCQARSVRTRAMPRLLKVAVLEQVRRIALQRTEALNALNA